MGSRKEEVVSSKILVGVILIVITGCGGSGDGGSPGDQRGVDQRAFDDAVLFVESETSVFCTEVF